MKTWSDKHLILTLIVLSLVGLVVFLFGFSNAPLSLTLRLRGPRLAAFFLVALCTSFSTILFQSLTHNRLLTPNVMGMDSLYTLFQLVFIYLWPTTWTGPSMTLMQFILTSSGVVLASVGFFLFFFKKYPNHIPLMLLFGLVFNILIQSTNDFLSVIMDPDDYTVALSKSMVSFHYIDPTLLIIAALFSLPIVLYLFRSSKELDVLRLGTDYATNLGLQVNQRQFVYFALLAILTSLATALVGPVTFLGFLGVNLAYFLLKNNNHHLLFITSGLLLFLFICYGQLLVEQVFQSTINLGIFIEFFGGLYFLLLLMKGRQSV